MPSLKSYQARSQKAIEKLINTAEMQYNAFSSMTFTWAGHYTNVLSIKSQHDKLSYAGFRRCRMLNKGIANTLKQVITLIEPGSEEQNASPFGLHLLPAQPYLSQASAKASAAASAVKTSVTSLAKRTSA